MRRHGFLFALVLWGVGCGGDVMFYSPPAQRPPLTGDDPEPGLGRFVRMSDRNAARYLVSGFREAEAGAPGRWADQHPRMRFFLLSAGRLRFTMEFAIPASTFRITGPVTLSFAINGHPLDTMRFDHSGQLEITRAVPPAWLHANAENLVAIDSDKVWVSPEDGARLAFVLGSAGFIH
jgi:hypothetical protein